MKNTNELEIFCFSFILILLAIISIIRFTVIRTNAEASFMYKKRTKRINWIKLSRWLIVIQLFSLLLKYPDISDNLLFVFGLPLILMFILIVYAIFYNIKPSTSKEYDDFDQKEYESYKKAFERDKKLRKLL